VTKPKRLEIPICPYCGRDAVFSPRSDHIYRKNWGPVWECDACAAIVGCHQATMIPLGSLATSELRGLRQRAHELFDARWITGGVEGRKLRRNAAYQWLGERLNLSPERRHIGHLNEEQCRYLITLLEKERKP
jgi:hypothetical protein